MSYVTTHVSCVYSERLQLEFHTVCDISTADFPLGHVVVLNDVLMLRAFRSTTKSCVLNIPNPYPFLNIGANWYIATYLRLRL